MPKNDQWRGLGDETLQTLFRQMAHHKSLDSVHFDANRLYKRLSSHKTASRRLAPSDVMWWTAVGAAFTAVVALALTNIPHGAARLSGRRFQSTASRVQTDQKIMKDLQQGIPLLVQAGPFRVLVFRLPAEPSVHPGEMIRGWYQGGIGTGKVLSLTWGQYAFFSNKPSLWGAIGQKATYGGLSLKSLPGVSVPVQARWIEGSNAHAHEYVASVPFSRAQPLQVTRRLDLAGRNPNWSVSYRRETFTGHGTQESTGMLTVIRHAAIPKGLSYDLVLAPGLLNMKQGTFGQNTRRAAWADYNLAWTGTPKSPDLILKWPGHRVSIKLHKSS